MIQVTERGMLAALTKYKRIVADTQKASDEERAKAADEIFARLLGFPYYGPSISYQDGNFVASSCHSLTGTTIICKAPTMQKLAIKLVIAARTPHTKKK